MGKQRFLTRFGNMELCEKVPILELAGESRVLIENHTGVLSYAQEEIAVRVRYGCLRIVGQNMKLAEMHRDQLVIFGQIEGVFLHRR